MPLTSSNTLRPNTEFSYIWNISTNNCTDGVILTYSETLTTLENGVKFVTINTENLSDIPNVMCEYRDGSLRAILNFSDIIFNSVTSQRGNFTNLTVSDTGFFKNIGTNIRKVVRGVFKFLQADEINSTNSTSVHLVVIDDANINNLAALSASVSTFINDTDWDGNRITNVGGIIMQGVITSKDIIPVTTGLYSLGNSSNWFKELFVEKIRAINISATSINASDIASGSIKSQTLNVSSNMTIAGYDVSSEEGNLVITLT